MTVSSYWDEIEMAKKQSLVDAFTTYINNDISISQDIMLINALFFNANTFTIFISHVRWEIGVNLLMLSVLPLIGAFYVAKMIYTALKYIAYVMMHIPIYCYILLAAWIFIWIPVAM